jgi:acyl carrier protein
MLTERHSIELKVVELIAGLAKIPAEDIQTYQLLNDDLGIDSIRILELLSYIEDAFHFEMDVDDINPENFNSVNSVIQFVEGKVSR